MGARRDNSVMEAALQSVRGRLNKLLEHKNTTVNAVYSTDKSTARTVYNQLSGKYSLGADTLLSLLDAFPDVSSEWVMRGVGSMILEPRKLSNEHVLTIGDGNITAIDNSSVNQGVKETNIDYKESYLIIQGELKKAKAQLEIYEPIAKKALGIE